LFAYDTAIPYVDFLSDYTEPVVVIVEGTDPEVDRRVEPQGANSLAIEECLGTGVRVETESGDLVGRVAEQACPGWRLTISGDGSLSYQERDD